jgi:PAS domain S-box-containing protein
VERLSGGALSTGPGVWVGDSGRTKAELIAEVEALRKQLAALEADQDGELPRTLEALRESEARYRRLAENASDLIHEMDAEWRILFVSPNREAFLGRPGKDVIGHSILDAEITENVHPEDRELLAETFRGVDATGTEQQFTYRFQHGDGSWHWFESKGRTFRTSEGELRAVVISRDVTEREEALRKLRQSERRYRVLSEAIYDVVAELDEGGRMLFVSPSSEAVLGYRPEELVGTTPFGLLHANEVERLVDLFLGGFKSSSRPKHDEIFRVRHRDGSWRWLQSTGVTYRTGESELRMVAVSRDVTGIVNAAEERRKLEERIQQAQKLESLGMMAGGVAHDFNNLLTPILGDASLALMDLPDDSEVRVHLQKIQRAAHRAASLTNQLLDYAGIGSIDTEPLDLSRLVLEMGQLLQSAVSKKAVLAYDLANNLPAIDGDASQLSQVVMNLITNASEAIETRQPRERRIAIRSGTVEADRKSLSQVLLGEVLPEGTYVYFEVEDTGCGMDAETRARIFDPFFTTKFSGRGLGLAAVLGIVRKHGGAIEIESAVNRGTRVRVLCPAVGQQVQRAKSQELDPGSWRASGTVLVADDDEGACELMAETLGRTGLRVLRAHDGAQAAEIFREHADAIRLVVLDRTLSGESGAQALEDIRRIRRDVPVLLVSGYSQEDSAQRFAGEHGDGFLQKPFLPETLLEKVRDLLEN